MRRTLATTAAATLLAAGCSSSSTPAPTGVDAPPATPLTLRLGFVTSLTQAPALIGIQDGFFAKNLGPSIALRPIPFRTDTAEETALAAGKLDAAYASPTTILNVIQAAHASHIKIVSGAASGGAELVVKPSITTPAQLKGGTLAVPAPGGTQDIALRYWLRLHHLATTITAGGSEVSITAGTPGTTTVSDFTTGHITGAWETAPYDVEMTSHGGRVLVNEASLWPSGQFATTNLVVTQSFLAPRLTRRPRLAPRPDPGQRLPPPEPHHRPARHQQRTHPPDRCQPATPRPRRLPHPDHLYQRPHSHIPHHRRPARRHSRPPPPRYQPHQPLRPHPPQPAPPCRR